MCLVCALHPYAVRNVFIFLNIAFQAVILSSIFSFSGGVWQKSLLALFGQNLVQLIVRSIFEKVSSSCTNLLGINFVEEALWHVIEFSIYLTILLSLLPAIL